MKFQMADGSIVETENAKSTWEEDTNWNGHNHISVNTGTQWDHETLYLSKKDRYYLVHYSQWEGSLPSANFIEDHEAARWLLHNSHELWAFLVFWPMKGACRETKQPQMV